MGFIDLRRRRTSRTRHGGYGFLQIHTDSLIGKPGTRSTICIRLGNTWAFLEYTDDNVSISDGRLSPDFGEMWKYGCPRSLERDSEYDGEIVDGAKEKEESEHDVECAVRVGGPSWGESVRVDFVPDNIVCVHTMQDSTLFVKKDVESSSLPLSERSSVRYDESQLFRFHPDASWLCFIPMCEIASSDSFGEWT